jgi:uncharacterized protein
MSEMIQVTVDNVRVNLMAPYRLVVLRDMDKDRYLPIWVGPSEAESITVALQEVEMARPLTHDLLKNVFGVFNAQITRIEIVSLRAEVFYANIITEFGGRTLAIDARPSDAIALAVRAHVPIFVAAEVMETAGIIPEDDMGAETSPSLPAPASESRDAAQPAEPADDRLSIFEDFLENLGGDGDANETDADEPPKA